MPKYFKNPCPCSSLSLSWLDDAFDRVQIGLHTQSHNYGIHFLSKLSKQKIQDTKRKSNMKLCRILSTILLCSLTFDYVGGKQHRRSTKHLEQNDPTANQDEEIDPVVVLDHIKSDQEAQVKSYELARNLAHNEAEELQAEAEFEDGEPQEEGDRERYLQNEDADGEWEDLEAEEENEVEAPEGRNLRRRSHSYWNGSYRSPRRHRRRHHRSGSGGHHHSGSRSCDSGSRSKGFFR